MKKRLIAIILIMIVILSGCSTPKEAEPIKDDMINVLMIGNSFCRYYVEELYGMAAAADVDMKVYNLYYGGCPMENHWNWLQQDKNMYEFYVTDAEGRRQVTALKVTLKQALEEEEWDVISLQDGSNTQLTTQEELVEHAAPYAKQLYAYLREQFPNARYLWHHTWAYEVGYVKEEQPTRNVPDKANQTERWTNNRAVANYIQKENDVDIVPSGDAWEMVRSDGYFGLCGSSIKPTTKSPNNTYGDYFHDGDLGGGQYLNACVWFETITGKSCIGNTYEPEYTLNFSKEKLQQYAHKAVSEMYGEAE